MDVTIGTIRIVYVQRGNKRWAPVLGFFEVLIWLLAIGQIMRNLTNIFCYVAYAGGFAMGNLIGLTLEEKLAMGKLLFRVITQTEATRLVERLRKKGFGVTCMDATGSHGDVKTILMVIERYDLPDVIELVERYNPNAFYSIEDTRLVRAGVFPRTKHPLHATISRHARLYRRMRLYWRTILSRDAK